MGLSRPMALVLVALCVAGLVLSADTTLVSYALTRIYVWLVALVPGMALALACAGVGDCIVRRVSDSLTMTERLTLSLAAGLGLMPIAVGLLGFTTGMPPWSGLMMVGAGLVAGIPLWRAAVRRLMVLMQHGPAGHTPVALALVGLISMVFVLLMGFALTPPVLFDVTEYHLGPWWEYSRTGWLKFTPQHHNFYARFPFPVESLYYLGLLIMPAMDTAPKLLNALCVLACAALVSATVRRAGSPRPAPLLALLAALTLPVMLDVSVDAMIDAPVALMVFAAAALMIFHGKESGCPRALPVMAPGMRAGLSMMLLCGAVTAKYTAAQLYLLPWLIIAAPMLWQGMRRKPIPLVLFALPCLAMAGVWFGKNYSLYGNPLEPFFQKYFTEESESILNEKFYIESHYPQSPLSADYWASLLPRLHEFTWLYLLAAVIGLWGARRREMLRVFVFCGGAFLLWNTVRESQDRFLLPAMMLMVTVAVVSMWELPTRGMRRVAAGCVLIFCALNGFQYALKFHGAESLSYLLEFGPGYDLPEADDPPTAREAFVEKNLGDLGRVITKLHRLPGAEKQRVALIYEARPYLFRPANPANTPQYTVVWEDNFGLLDGDTTASIYANLRKQGYTHVLINRQELLRYIQQYARPAHLKNFGLPAGSDPRAIWGMTRIPEDFYPPFYRSFVWNRFGVERQAVLDFLADVDRRAVIREGGPAPSPGAQPLDIVVAPVPGSKNSIP